MKKLLNVLLAAAGVALCTGIATAAILTQADVAPYLHPQRLVDVNGHRMNLYCTGHGSPAVILDAGAGYGTDTWRKVQPQVAKFTRVCSYDRAGMGFSAAAPLPRDASATVNDLHTLLKRAGIAGPYLLVGHSIAGLYEPLFADRYPQEVRGMVLVDPSFPNQDRVLEAASPALKRLDRSAGAQYRSCYVAALHGRLVPGTKAYADCGLPPAAAVEAQCKKMGAAWCELAKLQVSHALRPAFWLMLGSEITSASAASSAEDLKEQRSYGAMPFIVLTAANDNRGPSPIPRADMKAVERAWIAGHDRLARLSSAGVNFLVHGSGHFIHDDRPSTVISAIAEVVAQARGR